MCSHWSYKGHSSWRTGRGSKKLLSWRLSRPCLTCYLSSFTGLSCQGNGGENYSSESCLLSCWMNNFERARIVYKNENAILSHSYKKKKKKKSMRIFCSLLFQISLFPNIKVKKTQFCCNWASRLPGKQPYLPEHHSSAQNSCSALQQILTSVLFCWENLHKVHCRQCAVPGQALGAYVLASLSPVQS